MDASIALRYANQIVEKNSYKKYWNGRVDSFPKYQALVVELIRNMSKADLALYKQLKDFLITWKKMGDEFEDLSAKDPLLLYTPQHQVALDFHSSNAFFRYFRAGNRTSKTYSGYIEDAMFLTGSHRWLEEIPQTPVNICLLTGLEFSVYANKTFEAKFLNGEPGSGLPPIFPEDGKWFYHYDRKTYTITLVCKKCAEAGTKDCKHTKSTIKLFTIERPISALESFIAALIHLDEWCPEPYFHAARQRLMTTRGGRMIMTCTPLQGPESWDSILAEQYSSGYLKNVMNDANPNSPPYLSLHEISMPDAGLAGENEIAANIKSMDEFEIESRIYGRPAALAEKPVFQRSKLHDQLQNASEPKYIQLGISKNITEVSSKTDLVINELQTRDVDVLRWAGIRLWEAPISRAAYILCADTASGMAVIAPGSKKLPDASCCSVLKVVKEAGKIQVEMVAQFWGWLNGLDYGDEIYKLALWYNDALVVIETTGGYGLTPLLRLKQDLCYWNIFQDKSDGENVKVTASGRMGLDTNQSTKPAMVGSLQYYIKNNLIKIPCKQTIRELTQFAQEKSENGTKVHYRGAKGSKDDRVMSLALGTYTLQLAQVYETLLETEEQPATNSRQLESNASDNSYYL